MEKEYYYHDGNREFGPYDYDELQNKRLTHETLFWHEGLIGWKRGDELPELFNLFKFNNLAQQDDSLVSNSFKLYNGRSIFIGTFLGGPLAAGYFVTENLKKFNQKGKIKKAWMYSILATLIVFITGFLVPDDSRLIYNILIVYSYAWVITLLSQYFQRDQLKLHIENNGEFYVIWKAVPVGLIALILMIIVAFIITFGVLFIANIF